MIPGWSLVEWCCVVVSFGTKCIFSWWRCEERVIVERHGRRHWARHSCWLVGHHRHVLSFGTKFILSLCCGCEIFCEVVDIEQGITVGWWQRRDRSLLRQEEKENSKHWCRQLFLRPLCLPLSERLQDRVGQIKDRWEPDKDVNVGLIVNTDSETEGGGR